MGKFFFFAAFFGSRWQVRSPGLLQDPIGSVLGRRPLGINGPSRYIYQAKLPAKSTGPPAGFERRHLVYPPRGIWFCPGIKDFGRTKSKNKSTKTNKTPTRRKPMLPLKETESPLKQRDFRSSSFSPTRFFRRLAFLFRFWRD